MSFQDLVTAAQGYFPKLQIKYKDESPFMRFIGKLLFFNPGFMTDYSTTIGNTVYFPSQNNVKLHPISSSVVFMHELVHLYDQKRMSKPVVMLSYLFPQILALLCIPLFFLISWKIMLPLTLLFLAPLPAPFRMHWEKRAYLSSLYVLQLLGKNKSFNPHLDIQKADYENYFKNSSYYFMWPFSDINKQFDKAVQDVNAGQKPYEDPVFNMLEDLVTKI